MCILIAKIKIGNNFENSEYLLGIIKVCQLFWKVSDDKCLLISSIKTIHSRQKGSGLLYTNSQSNQCKSPGKTYIITKFTTQLQKVHYNT